MRKLDDSSKLLRKNIARVGSFFVLGVVFFSVVLFGSLIALGISFYSVSGDSMNPTFEDKDTLVIRQADEIEVNHIIFFNKPSSWDRYVDTGDIYVKRVIAKPYDILDYNADSRELSVNGDVVYSLPDSYECKAESYQNTLTLEQVFVMGDNHENSLDSLRILCDGSEPDSSYVPKMSMKNYGEVIYKF